MPRHTTMWLATGGAAMLSAALTYVATRPAFATAWNGLRRTAGWSHERCKRFGSRRDVAADDPAASGIVENAAFREYREATLHRLDEEEREFRAFLDRIRASRDRAEMDAFIEERRRSGTSSDRSGAV